MIQDCPVDLPHGITLHCRVSGIPGRPVLLFLHGFPEGAFIWDELLLHFARPENGGYRCVAPYLRVLARPAARRRWMRTAPSTWCRTWSR